MTSWKAVERKIAQKFGTTRTPLSGGNGKVTRSDTLHDSLFIEIKHSKRPPGVLLFRKVKELARREGKIPILVYKHKGTPLEYVILDLDNLIKLLGSEFKPKT